MTTASGVTFKKSGFKGVTILLVTHDVEVAAKTGRMLFILDGKIAASTCPAYTMKPATI